MRGGKGEWIEDRLNPNRARDPFGANSVAHGTGYTVPERISPDPEVPSGTLGEIRFDSQVFDRRGVALYLPAVPRDPALSAADRARRPPT